MEIVRIDPKYRYGFHIRTRATLVLTVKTALEMKLKAMQLYLGNSRGYALAKASSADIVEARELIKERELYICAHAPLIYNPAGKADHTSPDIETTREKVILGMMAQLDIMAGLGGGVVVHVGSCKDKELGIKNIANTVAQCLTRESRQTHSIAKAVGLSIEEFKKKRLVILENADGAGTKIGVTLDEIASILKLIPEEISSQAKVCIDTAHIFGAGQYDFGKIEDLERFYSDFDDIIGLEKLELFHLNDSRRSESKRRNAFFGSRKDQHEYLGMGYIFDEEDESRTEALRRFFLIAREKGLPIIGEPPKNVQSEDKLVNGPGGKREREYICTILRNSSHPLEY